MSNFDLVPSLFLSLPSAVNVMRCFVCHKEYKQIDIIDNYFVKDTTEATSTSDEKSAQVCKRFPLILGIKGIVAASVCTKKAG